MCKINCHKRVWNQIRIKIPNQITSYIPVYNIRLSVWRLLYGIPWLGDILPAVGVVEYFLFFFIVGVKSSNAAGRHRKANHILYSPRDFSNFNYEIPLQNNEENKKKYSTTPTAGNTRIPNNSYHTTSFTAYIGRQTISLYSLQEEFDLLISNDTTKKDIVPGMTPTTTPIFRSEN